MLEKKVSEQLPKGECERKEERAAKVSEKNEEERGEKRKREEEKEENQADRVNTRRDALSPVEAL